MGNLVGISGTYVDDIIRAGNKNFREESTKCTHQTFDAKHESGTPLNFTGLLHIEGPKHCRKISQMRYIYSLNVLQTSADFEAFRSLRAKLTWVSNSRPDIASAVALASQISPSTFTPDSHKLLNKIVKHLKNTKDIQLCYPKLDSETIYLAVYADASLNNNNDHTSQLGYIILLTEHTSTCCILHFYSHKYRRVTRSSMAAEALAFSDAFDHAFIIKHDS
jgi:hypothetical protein